MKIWQQNCQELPLNTLRGQSQARQNQSNSITLEVSQQLLKKRSRTGDENT